MSQHSAGKNILVVDRDSEIADLYTEMLLMDNISYNVTTALSGKECLQALRIDRPDMILMDIELIDISGWKLIEKIKQQKSNIPVVIVTVKPPSPEDFERLASVFDYLIKPITIDGLHMAVRDALCIPYLIEKCMETLRNSNNQDDIVHNMEKKYLLMKHNIMYRKHFILLRQLYPDRKLENEPEMKKLLETLKKQIMNAYKEIEFKKKEYRFHNIIM